MGRLNIEQYRASRGDGGINLVIAGAGTGKTVTLVEKVRSLMRWGNVPPENILVLTFSRKAAGELRERIFSHERAEKFAGITVGTFHSFSLSLLKSNSRRFMDEYGFTCFPEIADDPEREKMIGRLIGDMRHEFMGLPDRIILRYMEKSDWSPMEKKKLAETGLDRAFERLRTAYVNEKRESALMDYDDIIRFCNGMLERSPDMLAAVTARFTHVLVDEYQDTSDSNFRLLKFLMSRSENSLFAVGDDWQAIYGFRNARVEYIIDMKRHFPAVKVHRLTRNYRSRRPIVSLSNRFIRGNRKRTRKRLVSQKGRGGVVRHCAVKLQRDEPELMRRILARHPGETAILYRNNWQGEYYRSCSDGILVRDNVSFMTIHSSKGLEFETVIIAGVSDSVIPDRSGDLEEERRLFYVALTRAKENLYIISLMNDDGSLPLFGRELSLKPKGAGVLK
jgi:DNA helicase-2/ATP-dependent DNA helicase PcrA